MAENAFDEQDYLEGQRSAWLSLLIWVLGELGIDDPEAGKVRWAIEREQTVAMLRRVCQEHGDNRWQEDLHLADVIEKHLWRHLE